MMWILDSLDDLESDFSAIHRIDNMYAISGPRFFKFAYRMPAYKGILRLREEIKAQEEQEENNPSESSGNFSLSRDKVPGDEGGINMMNVVARTPGDQVPLIQYANLS